MIYQKLCILETVLAKKAKKRAIYVCFGSYLLNGWRYDKKKAICCIWNSTSFKMSGNSIGLSRKLHFQSPKIPVKAKKRVIYVRFHPYFLNGWRYDKKKAICYTQNLISWQLNDLSKTLRSKAENSRKRLKRAIYVLFRPYFLNELRY